MIKNNNRAGFTIAEIVVAMLILGGIATILLPVILNNTREKINEVSLNKTYSMFQQNSRSVGLLISQGKIAESSNPVNTFFDAFAYMNKSKQGKTGGNSQMKTYLADYSPEFAQGDTSAGDCKINGFLSTDSNTLILNNGVFVMAQETNCNIFDELGQTALQNNGGNKIIVDTNGVKGPNKVGQDIFFFDVVYDDNGSYSVRPCAGSPAAGAAACGGDSSKWFERMGCGKKILGMNN